MKKYELMVIVNAQKTQEEKDGIFKQAVDAIAKNGGKITNNQVWLDKHKLAFSLKKYRDATYYLIKFECLASVIDKIKQIVRMNEDILRFLISKAE